MWLSAVSIGVAIAFSGSEPVQLNEREAVLWKRLEPALARVLVAENVSGAAALIDSRGYFLAHKGSVPQASVQIRLSDGRTLQARLRSTDEPTQLVLLVAENWSDDRSPVRIVQGAPAKGERLFAVLPSGPIRAELFASDRVGLINPSRRVMPLNEIRLEAPLQEIGGALIFTQSGELVGALQATLEPPTSAQEKSLRTTKIPAGLGALPANLLRGMQQGPGDLAVAYTVGPEILQRVIDGFRSPTHEVAHPAIGIFCKDAPGEGAVVDSVQPGSPAAMAGLMPGDVIIEMAGQPIEDQIDFGRVMIQQAVGSRLNMKLKRKGVVMHLVVPVGKS